MECLTFYHFGTLKSHKNQSNAATMFTLYFLTPVQFRICAIEGALNINANSHM